MRVCGGGGEGGIIESLRYRLIKCLNFAFHVVKQRSQLDDLAILYANLYNINSYFHSNDSMTRCSGWLRKK